MVHDFNCRMGQCVSVRFIMNSLTPQIATYLVEEGIQNFVEVHLQTVSTLFKVILPLVVEL